MRLGRGGRALRIAYGRIFHEACAYSPLSTSRQDFERVHRLEGAELARAAALGGTELAGFFPAAELTGFTAAAKAARDVETVPLASSLAVPSGPLTAECFAWLVDDLCERLQRAGALDGVYLALHGSMQVEGLTEPPEAVVLRRVRALVGADAKIAVSYDLHANLSAGLIDPVDVLIGYRSNPHWDLAPTGFRAGNRLIRALRGQVTPVHAWRKLPMVLGGGTTIDFLAPMRDLFRWMKRLERRDRRVLSASLFMVHPYTSADDLGWAVHVCTDGDQALAERLADELADRAWEKRRVPIPEFLDPDAAIEAVRASRYRRLGPVTLVDCDDIVGAGAPGGNTHLAKALIERAPDLTSYVPIHDPVAVEAVWAAPVGATVDVTVAGTPGYDMPAIDLARARVAGRGVGRSGRVVRLVAGNVHIAITERPPLPIHPSFWGELGAPVRDADVVVQKNFFHYRMFYLAHSFDHIPVKSAGATSMAHVTGRAYRVPVFPSADPGDWRPFDPVLRAASGFTPAGATARA